MTAAIKRRKQAPSRTAGRKPRAAKAKSRPEVTKAAQVRAREEAHELKEALAKASGTGNSGTGGRQPARKLSAKERETLRGLVIYLDDDARKRLARLAVDQGRTTQDLGIEAVNLLFQLYEVDAVA